MDLLEQADALKERYRQLQAMLPPIEEATPAAAALRIAFQNGEILAGALALCGQYDAHLRTTGALTPEQEERLTAGLEGLFDVSRQSIAIIEQHIAEASE